MAINSHKVFLIAAARTTVAPVGGFLRNTSIEDMAAAVIRENLSQLKMDTSEVDDVIVSNAL